MNRLGGSASIGIVLIGRNEGDRLVRALASISAHVTRRVYVDSGSTDDSLAAAAAAGAEVVTLDTRQPFTAARARNAGFEQLMTVDPVDLVQFIDGDCEMQAGWIETARDFLVDHQDVAVVCGRRRERFPDASVYNRLCDWEWDTPVGEALACGGDAMMRTSVFRAVGGFNPTLIAGEEPELCVRIRQAGWRIWRLGAEMTLHDAAMTRLSQWWKRTRRAGHAFAEGAAMHGSPPERHSVAPTRRAVLWGGVLPVAAIGAAWPTGGLSLALFLAYPAQILRLAQRGGIGAKASWERALFLTMGKVPEALGVAEYWLRRLVRRPAGLIEYK
jgi:GT2 family glycosyltransferase